MKEIKAHVRPERVEAVVMALHEAGVPHLTITHVQALGSGVDPSERRMSLEAGEWYTEKAKVELVCPSREAERLVAAIRRAAHTGDPGDGIVFVAPVERAVKVRVDVEGSEALA